LTTATTLNLRAEVAAITAALEARRDPAYEWGMRRTVPSQQPAHATRVPDVRTVASDWRRAHRDVPPADVLTLCEALWATRWREERIVAIALIAGSRPVLAAVRWDTPEAWSRDIDNWEHVDHLAGITGRLLVADPTLLARNQALESSASPWQRRLALVTLIVAFMKASARPDPRRRIYRDELASMAGRLENDKHPIVRRAVTWARDRLAKDHLDG
jgi:3-methyladenine DNA glycosylase AlkD